VRHAHDVFTKTKQHGTLPFVPELLEIGTDLAALPQWWAASVAEAFGKTRGQCSEQAMMRLLHNRWSFLSGTERDFTSEERDEAHVIVVLWRELQVGVLCCKSHPVQVADT
jgi:hypothetical protein